MYVSALFGPINVYVTSSTKVLQYSEKEREKHPLAAKRLKIK